MLKSMADYYKIQILHNVSVLLNIKCWLDYLKCDATTAIFSHFHRNVCIQETGDNFLQIWDITGSPQKLNHFVRAYNFRPKPTFPFKVAFYMFRSAVRST